MTFLLALLLLFLRSSYAAEPSEVILIVDTAVGDTTIGDADTYEAMLRGRLRQLYPGTPFYMIRASEETELRDGIAAAMERPWQVRALVVESHGYSSNTSIVYGYHSHMANRSQRIDIDLVSEGQVHYAFSSLIGRFAPGARIVFSGCQMVDAGEEPEKMDAMAKVAENFGLKDGSIYMNHTDGSEFTEAIVKQPFTVETGWVNRSAHLSLQLMAVVSYPIGEFMEHVVSNWGYRYTVDSSGAKLTKDDLVNAETRAEPSGKLVLRR
jgi:hypothetical protein